MVPLVVRLRPRKLRRVHMAQSADIQVTNWDQLKRRKENSSIEVSYLQGSEGLRGLKRRWKRSRREVQVCTELLPAAHVVRDATWAAALGFIPQARPILTRRT
jgi:hypothetical protein